jgi:hypothetical protein
MSGRRTIVDAVSAMAVMAKPPTAHHVVMVKKPVVRAYTITLVTAW